MNSEARRVYAFIGAGLIVAVFVGIGVWRLGSPESPTSSNEALVTNVATTESTTSGQAPTSSKPHEQNYSREQDREEERINALPDDPFLAPNAVVNPPQRSTGPTAFYRPDNLSTQNWQSPEPTVLAEPTDLEPTGTTSPSETSEPETPQQENSTSEQTSTPPNNGSNNQGAEATSPQQPGNPSQPEIPGLPGLPDLPTIPGAASQPNSSETNTPDEPQELGESAQSQAGAEEPASRPSREPNNFGDPFGSKGAFFQPWNLFPNSQ